MKINKKYLEDIISDRLISQAISRMEPGKTFDDKTFIFTRKKCQISI